MYTADEAFYYSVEAFNKLKLQQVQEDIQPHIQKIKEAVSRGEFHCEVVGLEGKHDTVEYLRALGFKVRELYSNLHAIYWAGVGYEDPRKTGAYPTLNPINE